jgi:hypothetical protein
MIEAALPKVISRAVYVALRERLKLSGHPPLSRICRDNRESGNER